MKFKDLLNENLMDVGKLIQGILLKEGYKFKFSKKMGFIKFALENNISIVWDGVGIEVKNNSKSLYYSDSTPKLDYKIACDKAIDAVNDLNESADDHNYSKMTLKELEFLLKHHKEDKIEGGCPDEIDEDIKEIEDAIKALKMNEASAESILRDNGFKIKSVHGTKFGTEYIMAKKYKEDEIKDILKDFTLKFDEKSIFIIG